MKVSTFILISLLLAFTTKTSFFTLAKTNNNSPILDANGHPLQTGAAYYVVSLTWGAGGGGLALGTIGDKTCPEFVVQRLSDVDNGSPLMFSNVDGTDDVVCEDSYVNVEFVPLSDRVCTTSTVWQVVWDESVWLRIGGVKGEPHSLFKIKSNGVNYGYRFKYCPSEGFCEDIGRYGYGDGEQLVLGVGAESWPWVFVKVQNSIKQVFKY